MADTADLCARDELSRKAWQRILARADGLVREPRAEDRGLVEEVVLWTGFVYLMTRDRRYGRCALAHVLSLARGTQPPAETSAATDSGSARTAFLLALGYDWLNDLLKPAEAAEVAGALMDGWLRPYSSLTKCDEWRERGLTRRLVVTAVASVSAVALLDETEGADEALEAARTEMSRILDEMPDDGGWPEGVSAWEHAVSHLAYHIAALESALGEGLDIVLRDCVRRTGYFPIFFRAPDGRAVNFGECDVDAPVPPALHYLARRTGRFELSSLRDSHAEEPHPFDLLWRDARASRADVSGAGLCPSRAFPDTGWAALRSTWEDASALYVALRGGDLKAEGSHLDLGTFVLVAGGERFACDPGPGVPGTGEHNTLIVRPSRGDGGRESSGRWHQAPSARARIAQFLHSAFLSVVGMDCTEAFGARVRVWRREAMLVAGEYVVLIDEVVASNEAVIEWRLHTDCDARVDGARARLSGQRTDLAVALLGFSAEPATERLPSDHRKMPSCQAAPAHVEAQYEAGAHPHVVARGRAAPRLIVVAVLAPVARGEPAPEVEGLFAEGVVGAKVRRGEVTDRLLINVRGAGGAEAARVYFEGHQALVRRRDRPDGEGRVTHAALRDGLSVVADREFMFGAHSVASAVLDLTEMSRSGMCVGHCWVSQPTGMAFTTWTQAATVRVNGREVESESVGGMVAFELPSAGEHAVEVLASEVGPQGERSQVERGETRGRL
ncbi:MAG: heparinase II/III family protein [Armatimonadota bacterium]